MRVKPNTLFPPNVGDFCWAPGEEAPERIVLRLPVGTVRLKVRRGPDPGDVPDGPVWGWDGDLERPTLTPSINTDAGDGKWHGYRIGGGFGTRGVSDDAERRHIFLDKTSSCSNFFGVYDVTTHKGVVFRLKGDIIEIKAGNRLPPGDEEHEEEGRFTVKVERAHSDTGTARLLFRDECLRGPWEVLRMALAPMFFPDGVIGRW